jgi:ABC-type phosphate/phosphonate transport system substrate-binding protein
MAHRRAGSCRVPAARPRVLCGLFLAALLVASSAHAHRTVRFLIAVPGTVADATQAFAPLQSWLEAALDHVVEPVSASDWESRLDVWRTTRPEVVLADPVAYAACRASVAPAAVVAIESRTYYTVVVARPESRTGSLAFLRGAYIALGERGSAVGHLEPLTMLAGAGLSPADVRALHLEPDMAWKALTRGMVAAAAMEYAEFRVHAGDEADDFTIIASGEPLPPDILFLDENAGAEMARLLKEALARDRQGLEVAMAAAAARYGGARIDWVADDDPSIVEEQYARSLAVDGLLGPPPCVDSRAAR